jgi:hypothetical protein
LICCAAPTGPPPSPNCAPPSAKPHWWHDDAPAPLPEVPLRSCDFPPRLNGTRATGQTERRRRDVGAIDLKRLAAGERADD